MDHGLAQGQSPVDLPEDGENSGIGWTAGAIAVGSVLLIAFNSHALANWADQLPVVPATVPLIATADGWHARAGKWGLNVVVDDVAGAARAMRQADWPHRPESGRARR